MMTIIYRQMAWDTVCLLRGLTSLSCLEQSCHPPCLLLYIIFAGDDKLFLPTCSQALQQTGVGLYGALARFERGCTMILCPHIVLQRTVALFFPVLEPFSRYSASIQPNKYTLLHNEGSVHPFTRSSSPFLFPRPGPLRW